MSASASADASQPTSVVTNCLAIPAHPATATDTTGRCGMCFPATARTTAPPPTERRPVPPVAARKARAAECIAVPRHPDTTRAVDGTCLTCFPTGARPVLPPPARARTSPGARRVAAAPVYRDPDWRPYGLGDRIFFGLIWGVYATICAAVAFAGLTVGSTLFCTAAAVVCAVYSYRIWTYRARHLYVLFFF